MSIYVGVELEPHGLVESIVRGLKNEEILDFILSLDDRTAELEFTLELVRRLVVSLAPDKSPHEFIRWLAKQPDIKKITEKDGIYTCNFCHHRWNPPTEEEHHEKGCVNARRSNS